MLFDNFCINSSVKLYGIGSAGSILDTTFSRINAAKKDRSIGKRAIAGIRDKSIRTGSTIGDVMVVSITMMRRSSGKNHERIASKNMAIYRRFKSSATVAART